MTFQATVEAGDMTSRDRLLAALRGRDVDRVPVWFMRQAGRYLPEFRAIRAEHSFEQRMKDPELAARITLQPLARFPLDAAILFSDILTPLEPLGHPARFRGSGPEIDDPVRTPEQVEAMPDVDPAEAIGFVGDAMARVREALPDHAVLGFAGAPFTLAAYLIEGGSSKGFAATKRFAYQHPEAWRMLTERLADVVGDHLAYQVESGADAVQVFDTWAEVLDADEYASLALPGVQRIVSRFRNQSSAPLISFARGTTHLLPHLGAAGADALSIDWRADLAAVREHYPDTPLQGNLDPTVLFAPPPLVRERSRAVLERLGGRAHVFNLGHGVLPGTPLEGVAAMVDEVVAWRP